MSAFVVYLSLYSYNKEGEYCDYTKDFDNYHIFVFDQPCLLQWQILWDFLFITFMWLIPIQIFVWPIFLYFKNKLKRIKHE